jgi:hypothetical protein
MAYSYPIGAPAFLPERRDQFARLAREAVEAVLDEAVRAMEGMVSGRSPEAFLTGEEQVLRLFATATGPIVAGLVSYLHHDGAWVAAVVAGARARALRPTRGRGWRRTPVLFLGGARLWIRTPYVMDDLRGRPGPTRANGRRGPTGSGSFPVLQALGIADQATAALRSEVARQTVRGSSFEEARQASSERGIDLDKKSVRAIALAVGEGALEQRCARREAARQGQVFRQEFAGARIVISVDGGRIRLREGGRRGRRGRHGHRRYRTPWREPKILAIYTIDARGRKVADLPMLYDGTLGDADATFEILAAELLLRGAAKAVELILVGDGALWIWNRAEDLARRLGLDVSRIVQVADFYHAVEHLTAISELCAGWSEARRKRWVRDMRRKLEAGQVDEVVKAAEALCRGRHAKSIRTEVEYFETRQARMRYAAFKRRGIPLGSGAVESAVRRVVNLRLKGPSMFWRGRNAERMLHLRAYLEAGRWRELMQRVLHRTPDGQQYGEANRAAA